MEKLIPLEEDVSNEKTVLDYASDMDFFLGLTKKNYTQSQNG
jgi:hypothetical protein